MHEDNGTHAVGKPIADEPFLHESTGAKRRGAHGTARIVGNFAHQQSIVLHRTPARHGPRQLP